MQLAVAICALALFAPSTASASSGQISNAFATPDWSHARFSISVEGTPCGSGTCSWYAVVLAQPSLPAYACEREEFFDGDPNTQVIWTGPSEQQNASFTASVSNVGILHGVYGQRLCLEIVGSREAVSIICEIGHEVLENPEPCPLEKFIFAEYLWGTMLTPESLPLPSASTPSPAPGSAPAPAEQPLKCPKGKRKAHRHGTNVCIRRHRRHHSKSRK
jgi:hypothetical protein